MGIEKGSQDWPMGIWEVRHFFKESVWDYNDSTFLALCNSTIWSTMCLYSLPEMSETLEHLETVE